MVTARRGSLYVELFPRVGFVTKFRNIQTAIVGLVWTIVMVREFTIIWIHVVVSTVFIHLYRHLETASWKWQILLLNHKFAWKQTLSVSRGFVCRKPARQKIASRGSKSLNRPQFKGIKSNKKKLNNIVTLTDMGCTSNWSLSVFTWRVTKRFYKEMWFFKVVRAMMRQRHLVQYFVNCPIVFKSLTDEEVNEKSWP